MVRYNSESTFGSIIEIYFRGKKKKIHFLFTGLEKYVAPLKF